MSSESCMMYVKLEFEFSSRAIEINSAFWSCSRCGDTAAQHILRQICFPDGNFEVFHDSLLDGSVHSGALIATINGFFMSYHSVC